MKRINIWSSPRNISTAFMYAFAQRKDITVVDEPLYAHYLDKTTSKAQHPGEAEVLATMEKDGEKIVQEVIFGNYDKPVVLFKQMTHHLIELNLDFLFDTDNVLLIRDPREIIASYAKVIPNPAMEDVGIEQQWQLFQKLKQAGKLTAVVDARELLLSPREVLIQLCARLQLDFEEGMLSWEAGARSEDGIWAKYWYANVHRSTGFKKYEKREIHLPENLEFLAQKCQPFYEELLAFSLKGA